MSASLHWLNYVCMNCPSGTANSKYPLPSFLSLLISWINNLHLLTLELTISQKKKNTIVVHKAGLFPPADAMLEYKSVIGNILRSICGNNNFKEDSKQR